MLIQSWNDAQYVQCIPVIHTCMLCHIHCCRRLQFSTVQTCILHMILLNGWSTSGSLLCVVNDSVHSVVPSCSNLGGEVKQSGLHLLFSQIHHKILYSIGLILMQDKWHKRNVYYPTLLFTDCMYIVYTPSFASQWLPHWLYLKEWLPYLP